MQRTIFTQANLALIVWRSLIWLLFLYVSAYYDTALAQAGKWPASTRSWRKNRVAPRKKKKGPHPMQENRDMPSHDKTSTRDRLPISPNAMSILLEFCCCGNDMQS